MQKWLRYFLILVGVVLIIGIIQLVMKQEQADTASSYRTVIDGTGTSVELPTHPKRVVILNASNLDLYAAAGGLGEIVGKPQSNSFSPDLAEAIKGVEEIGTIHQPSTEKIIGLKPDLVIGINVPFHNGLRDTLKQAHIPLYINDLNTYEDVLHTLAFYGELTGKEEAKHSIAKIEKEYEEASKLKKENNGNTLIIFGAPGSFNMATSKSFSGDLLRQLGGVNIADKVEGATGSYVALSMEYVAKANPDTIFIISMGADTATMEHFKEEMKGDPIWSHTRAVEQNRVFLLPNRLFTVNPGTEIGAALTWMANDLYGEGRS